MPKAIKFRKPVKPVPDEGGLMRAVNGLLAAAFSPMDRRDHDLEGRLTRRLLQPTEHILTNEEAEKIEDVLNDLWSFVEDVQEWAGVVEWELKLNAAEDAAKKLRSN